MYHRENSSYVTSTSPVVLTPISLSATSTASASAFGFRLRALRIRSCSVGEGVVQIEAVPWLPYGGTNRSSCALQVRPGLEGSEARGGVFWSKDESSRLSPGHRRMPRSLPISPREREPFLSVSTFPCRRGSVGEGKCAARWPSLLFSRPPPSTPAARPSCAAANWPPSGPTKTRQGGVGRRALSRSTSVDLCKRLGRQTPLGHDLEDAAAHSGRAALERLFRGQRAPPPAEQRLAAAAREHVSQLHIVLHHHYVPIRSKMARDAPPHAAAACAAHCERQHPT